MKRSILFILLLSICCFSFSQKKDKIKGDKEVVTIANDLPGGFHILEVRDDIDVILAIGTTNNYVLTTDKNLVNAVQFGVSGETLKIYSSSKIQSSKKLEVYLEVTDLDKIIVRDNVMVESKGRLSLEQLTIEGMESGNFEMELKVDVFNIILNKNSGGKINLRAKEVSVIMDDRTDLKGSIETDKLKVNLSNSATLDIKGNAEHADLSLKGTSNLKAKKLKTSKTKLTATNSSDIYVFVTKELEVYAEGRSKIFVYGNPSIELKGLTNKSKIIKK